MSQPSFYWHDYETWGVDPVRDRPCQFAGIRTDAELNEIGEPLNLFCRPGLDVLPSPEASLITGISPSHAEREGVSEREFMAAIHEQLAQPQTCGVGYNSIRFDDEISRHNLYRNFYDPYAREWQHGNSRWDLLDPVRAFAALRPQGIEWPRRDDGSASFKLEHLTVANGIEHHGAHDALSDVRATIALARLLRAANRELFDYLLALRDKRRVMQLLDLKHRKPMLHSSGRFPNQFLCTSLIVPLAPHPTNRNAVICADLRAAPVWLDWDAETIRERLYTASADLGEGESRPALKLVHCNRAPALAPLSVMDAAVEQRLALDRRQCERHYQQLIGAPDLPAKLTEVFRSGGFPARDDPDEMLYDGFFEDDDKRLMVQVRNASARELAGHWAFRDERLPELLWRYRARNFPDSLSPEEQARWLTFCRERWQNLPAVQQSLDTLLSDPATPEQRRPALQAFDQWLRERAAVLELGA
ncbi:MAG TPA: exodeoxyribonuclease I [Spongiibacteraceae bacterium]|jgi:exodeoxyribonuclease-1|nr:exodeoxyribonuclease I [Spongiibacteraceae bacterium]HUH38528.1 exodeoxyribonuclease I [Spongiibacteraceae bacterium]